MDCEPNKSAIVPTFSTVSHDDFLKQMQAVTLLGKTVEAMTVNQVQQMVKGSYSQTVWLLEQIDNNINYVGRSVDEHLCFPFDVIDYASRTVTENWRAFLGMESSAEQELAEQVETQAKQFGQEKEQLKQEIHELTRSISDKQEKLLQHKSEVEKEKKAKLAAQRAQRKLKAGLEASQGEVAKLNAEIKSVEERYDHTVSENTLLQAQIKQADLELVDARQETQQNISDADQLARKIETMAAEQEILIAEKDGLHKRIEELQQLLEKSSNYTE